MGEWQNHPDPKIREEGEKKLYNGYNTVINPLGYKYIEMIKGLNAFSVAKKYENLISENCNKLSISQNSLQDIFSEIELNAALFINRGKWFHLILNQSVQLLKKHKKELKIKFSYTCIFFILQSHS
jgi:oligoendopeptidase F